MLLRLIKYFRGYVEVTLWGYAPERFFNLCSNHDILVWDLRRQGDAYDFKISLQGFRCLKPLLKKSGTRVRIRKKSGLPFFFFRYRRRKILFAGIFGCMLVLFALSRFIWKININGNDSVTDDSLLKFLEENHSSYGTYISNVDCTKLEEEIRSSFKNVIWTSVKREGTTLTVDIQENLIVTADQAKAALPDDLKDQEQSGYDLLAVHGGTVESIYVRKGTPLVQKGDTVKKGDVLVSGLLPIYDDSQTVTGYQYCTADADIKIRTKYQYKDSFSAKYEQRVYSGRVQNRYGVAFGEAFFQIPWKKPGYTQYTVLETKNQLHLFDSFYLPVSIVKRTFEEYETRQAVYTKQEAKERAARNLTEFLEKLTQKGVLILEKNVMIKAGKNKYTVSGSITALENTFQYAASTEHSLDPGTDEEGNAADGSE